MSDRNSCVCHLSARHCAHCSVRSLFGASLQLCLWHRDGDEMLLAQGFAVKPGVGGWSRHLHGLKLALPCWHRLFLLWGNPYGLTPVAREHPQFFGLSVTTSLQSSVLAISPLPGPFLICPRLLIGLGPAPPDLLRSVLAARTMVFSGHISYHDGTQKALPASLASSGKTLDFCLRLHYCRAVHGSLLKPGLVLTTL